MWGPADGDKSNLLNCSSACSALFGVKPRWRCTMFTLVVTVDLPCYASIPSNSIESTQPICNVVLGSVVRMVTESELLRTQTCNHKSHKGFLCNKRQTQNLLSVPRLMFWKGKFWSHLCYGAGRHPSLQLAGEIVTWAPVCCNLNLHVAQMSPAT